MYHGMINVYKEAGYTSHDVVARLRGICKQKRIGHTGTLDPDAVGVLPVCLGNGTRLCDMVQDRQKEYVAKFRLGVTTDTQDISGTVLRQREVNVDPEEVRNVAASFVGEYYQLPPMYSALKVGGKKLCDLARAGKEVERKPRPVTIYSLEFLEIKHPDYTIKVVCSKGTYIRTLCHDIGEMLGCGGVMTGLTRTKAGEFAIEDALTLDELQKLADAGKLAEAVIPVEKMFASLPALCVKESAFKALKNGNPIRIEDVAELEEGKAERLQDAREEEDVDGQEFRVYSHRQIFYGVFRFEKERGIYTPVKMFFPDVE
ncbi:MAG: tRNA pseudouridine(55) synthase TruB [Clostridium sp.]|nr:tRNA pseudouridine(55) synthase TruB [Clostridium sp.]